MALDVETSIHFYISYMVIHFITDGCIQHRTLKDNCIYRGGETRPNVKERRRPYI